MAIAITLLYAKQYATPLPISDSKFQAMIERVAVLEAKVDELRDIIAEKDSLIAWYKARYGEIESSKPKGSALDLLKAGALEDALNEVLKTIQGEKLDTAIILKGQLLRTDLYKSKGMIDASEHTRMMSQISDSLLTLLKAE